MMKISKTTAILLQRLVNGESVAYSSLPKHITDLLCTEGYLTVRPMGSRRLLSAIDIQALHRFLVAQYGDLEQIISLHESGNQTRAGQASIAGNSKMVYARSCPGFPVNTYEPICCMLNGRDFLIEPQEGSFIFVSNWKNFVIPEDVGIVGIENMENFRMIRNQRALFESTLGNKRLLFVSRYPQSTDLRLWLQSIPNPYIHFGDFDLAGINIFLTEFHQHLGNRASFFIPTDIEERLRIGSMERYNLQYPKFHLLRSDIPSVQNLIDAIHKYHRCYDQEGYIETQIQ